MTEIFKQYPDIMTVVEAAAALRLSRNTVYELVRTGQLCSLSVGRRVLIPKRYLIRFAMRNAPAVLDNGQVNCYTDADAIVGETPVDKEEL